MIYHLFAWDNYYPAPSLDDYRGHFATADEAIAAGHELRGEGSDAFSVVYQDETGRLVELASSGSWPRPGPRAAGHRFFY